MFKETESQEFLRGEAEQKALLEKAAFIARVLGRRSDMLVMPGPNWAAGLSEEVNKILARGINLDEIEPTLLEPKILIYPERDLLTRNEDYILGVTRHEIGHFLFSDYRLLLDFQKKAREEGKNPADAQTLTNALEDPRVNNLLAGDSSRARERLENIYREDMPTVIANLGEKSPPIQFCFLAIAGWAEKFGQTSFLEEAIGRATSKKAMEAFHEASPIIEKVVSERKSKQAMETLENEIWPIYQRLVDDYLENPQEEQKQSDGSEAGEKQTQQSAREQLDRENQEFNETFGPKTMEAEKDEEGIVHYKPKALNDRQIEEFKKKIEESIAEGEAQERIKKARSQKETAEARRIAAGLSERRTGLTEGEQAKYNQYLSEMSPYINQLKRKLDEIFPKKEEFFWERGRIRGARVEAKKLAREAMTGRGLFFEKKEITEKPQVVCSILLDCSGSMHWAGAIELAVKEMIMISEALEDRAIDFELIAFSDSPEPIKEFGDDFNGAIKKKIIGLLQSGGGGTALGKSVNFAAERIARKMKVEKTPGFIVVHTDSQPGDDLKSVLEKWQGRFPVIGIGVGSSVSETSIKDYFGDAGRYTPNPIEAPKEILSVLKDQFSRYKKTNF